MPVYVIQGCKALPKPGSAPSACQLNGAWSFNSNGTITSAMDGNCFQVSNKVNGKGTAVNVASCTGKLDQIWAVVPATGGGSNIKNGDLCIDNNYTPALSSIDPDPEPGAAPASNRSVPVGQAGPKPPAPPKKVYNRSREVWVPPGEWTDAFGGDTATGPKVITTGNVSLDANNIYHRRGRVVVTALPSRNAAKADFGTLVLQCWPNSARFLGTGTANVVAEQQFFDSADRPTTWQRTLTLEQRGRRRDGAGGLMDDGSSTAESAGDGAARSSGSVCNSGQSPRTVSLTIGVPRVHTAPTDGAQAALVGVSAPARQWLARMHLLPGDTVLSTTLSGEEVSVVVHETVTSAEDRPTLMSGFTTGPSTLGPVAEVHIEDAGLGEQLELTLELC